MSIWCRLGIHRWDARTQIGKRRNRLYYVTENRCTRPGCRYHQWMIMDISPVRH